MDGAYFKNERKQITILSFKNGNLQKKKTGMKIPSLSKYVLVESHRTLKITNRRSEEIPVISIKEIKFALKKSKKQ